MEMLIKKLVVELSGIKMTVDMLYNVLSREDFYRLRQLVEEAQKIADRNSR
ncbi:MAG: hypothetical protein KGH61_04655 [Candidatus Micrarchaeota archaeon]|nr:hypothetical protein [Candidatus Micrarchaeota archaeon]MDE1848208.1 hypothetical protein [Candidatus Micrarchaeota archaeon]MDE1864856.1 hypothetical protein [Candidatus Micrarchaeota archaeon]